MEYEVYTDGTHLEHVSEFKYLGFVLDKSGTKVGSGRWAAGVIRSLLGKQLECARVLHETLLVPVLTYGTETLL